MRRALCLFLCLCLLSGCTGGEGSSAIQPESQVPDTPQAEEAPPPEEESEPVWEYRVSDRPYYRFKNVEPDWTADAAAFPAEFVEAAANAVYEQYPAKSCTLTKGFLYDLNNDGRQEAIFLLYAPVDDMDWYHGDSHFVYVNADGSAQFLMSGLNTGAGYDLPPALFHVQEATMQCRIIQYPGFNHVFVKSGTGTMASGSFFTVYLPQGGILKEGFSDNYPSFRQEDVFFVSTGPQGLGPRFTFWNIEEQAYCDVGGQWMPPSFFVQLMGEATFMKLLPEEWRVQDGFTADDIKSVEAFGKLYYRVRLQKQDRGEQLTFLRDVNNGDWAVHSIHPMDYDVRASEEAYVTDVDIGAALREAVSTPAGFDAIDTSQIDIASLPTELEPVCYNLLPILPTERPFLLYEEIPEYGISIYFETKFYSTLIRYGEHLEKFPWRYSYSERPCVEFADYDEDGEKELSVALPIGRGSGLSLRQLHIVKFGKDGQMTDYQLPESLYLDLQERLQVAYDPAIGAGRMQFDNQEILITEDEYLDKECLEANDLRIVIGDIIRFQQNGDQLDAEFDIAIYGGTCGMPIYVAALTADVVFQNGLFSLDNITLQEN